MAKRLVPEQQANKIDFYRFRIAKWAEHAAQLGLSAETVSQMDAKVQAAIEAIKAQREAQRIARSKTIVLNEALDEMAGFGSSVINQIRAQAGMSGPEIYTLASIDPPNRPSPMGEPGTPTEFQAKLDTATGALLLKWKCKHPRGMTSVMYMVSRCIGNSGAFVWIGQNGKKEFLDHKLPAGTSHVTYRIQAVRPTAVGKLADFPVAIGNDGSWPAAMFVNPRNTQIAA